VIRRGDRNRVDVVAGEQLAEVGVTIVRLQAQLPPERFAVGPPHVAGRDRLHFLHAPERLPYALHPPATPDASHRDAIIRRRLTCQTQSLGRHHHRNRRGSGSGSLQE